MRRSYKCITSLKKFQFSKSSVTQLTLPRPPGDLSIGVIVTGIIECWVHSIGGVDLNWKWKPIFVSESLQYEEK